MTKKAFSFAIYFRFKLFHELLRKKIFTVITPQMSDRKSQSQNQNQNSDKKDEAEYIANRYRIEEKKRGEKGATYLVTDTKINDELKCIKVLNVSTTNRNELKEIIREENVLSQIDNPYIVKYYESFINNDTICIVTEYCDVKNILFLSDFNINFDKKNSY